MPFTHNDINDGDTLTLKHRDGSFVVLSVLDGHRGIQVQTVSRQDDPMWVDIAEVVTIRSDTECAHCGDADCEGECYAPDDDND
jgi:hypothetical protein